MAHRDLFNDDMLEELEDSKWLDGEASELAGKLGSSLTKNASNLSSGMASMTLDDTVGSQDSDEASSNKPNLGAQVSIRYKGKDYSFVLGRSNPLEVPKSVLQALITMQKGEKKQIVAESPLVTSAATPGTSVVISTMTASDKTDSSAGSAASTETAELELLDFDHVIHVVNGGSIVKRVISCPEETRNDKNTPVFETVVTVDLEGSIEASGEVFDKKTHVQYRVGEGELGLGLERAIRTMHKGEKAAFNILPPWTDKITDNPGKVDLKTTPLRYVVYLSDFENAKSPFDYKTFEEHVEQATVRKDQGNKAHEAHNYRLAITKYTKAQFILELLKEPTPEQEEAIKQLKVVLALNLAASNLKLEEYEKVKFHCSAALQLDPVNVKGLYRRASACVALQLWEQAHKDTQKLLEIKPDDTLAKHLMKRILQKFQVDDKQQRETYQRIFAKLEEPTTPALYQDVHNSRELREKAKRTNYKWIGLGILTLLVLVLAVLFAL